jgi:hypothetical protein
METLRKQSLIVLAALVVSATCYAQSAEEIVAKNIQAVGGKDVVASTKSLVVTASIEVMGNEAPTTTTILNGKGFRSETEFQGSKIINCVSPAGSWMVNPMAGSSTPTAAPENEAKKVKSRMYIVPLAYYAEDGGKLELLGKDTADYKIKLTNDDGVNATYFINANTYLLDRMELEVIQGGQTVPVTITLSDYQKLDNGLMMAFKMQQDLPQFSMNFVTKKVEVNKEVDPAIFEMPK